MRGMQVLRRALCRLRDFPLSTKISPAIAHVSASRRRVTLLPHVVKGGPSELEQAPPCLDRPPARFRLSAHALHVSSAHGACIDPGGATLAAERRAMHPE
jgi:hypothetical protein